MEKRLRRLFKIDIPVEVKKTGRSQVVLYPSADRALIEYAYEDELVESFSLLRLGLDYSPLLATLWFQKDLSKEEEHYASMFYTLIVPLWTAWSWENAQKYLPQDMLEKEIQSIYEESQMFLMWTGHQNIPEHLYRKATLGLYLTTKALGYEPKLKLVGKHSKEWEEYINILESFLEKEPSPHLLAKLPEITKAPYRVRVTEKPYLHYEIRKR